MESSGIALVDGLVVTTSDSGDTGRVFTVDPDTGETVGVTQWEEDPEDVEALAPGGDGDVWVADIGDNSESRDSIEVTRVPVGRGDRTVDERPTTWSTPTARRTRSRCSPTLTGGSTSPPRASSAARCTPPRATLAEDDNRLQALGPVLPIATDGAFFPDGEHLVVRDYSRAAVYSFPGLEVGSFRRPTRSRGRASWSTTTAACSHLGGQFAPVLRVPLPADVRRAMLARAPSSSSAPNSSSGPSASASASAGSTAGDEAAESEQTERAWWPLLTAGVALGGLAVLVRSLRPR